MFPVHAAYSCQPLPHTCTVPQMLCVNGATVSEYYGLIRLPPDLRLPYFSFGLAYLPLAFLPRDRSRVGLPSSCVLLSTHTMLLVDPGRPSRTSPITVPLCWLLVG